MKSKNYRRKILAVLLVAAMVLTGIPTAVFASSTGTYEKITDSSQFTDCLLYTSYHGCNLLKSDYITDNIRNIIKGQDKGSFTFKREDDRCV